MKFTNKIMAFVMAVTIAATGCVNDSPTYSPDEEKPGTGTEKEMGYLDLGSVRAQVLLDAETTTQNASAQSVTRATYEDANTDYLVRIYNSNGEAVLDTTVGTLSQEFTDNMMELPVGSYSLMVQSLESGSVPAVSWTDGYYATDPACEFKIGRDNTRENPAQVNAEKEVVCKLQSVKVSVSVSADLYAEMQEKFTATVTMRGMTGGTATFTESKNGEENPAYMKPANTNGTNTLEFVLSGIKNGTESTLARTIEGVKKGQWRKIHVGVVHATTGEARIEVTVETLVMDSEITVDGVGSWQEPVLDEAEEPELVWEGHDIATDTFDINDLMFDEYGETFTGEIPVLKMAAASGLKSVLLTVSSASTTVDGAETDLELVTAETLPSAYRRLKIEEGAKEKSIDISGLLPIFFGTEDTHTLTFVMTDMKDKVGTATLTIIYGEPEDPSITCREFNISQPHTLVSETETINIDINSTAGIKEFWVQIVSEELEPLLPAIGLPTRFNLCDIQDQTLAKTLSDSTDDGGLGFPINNDVINKTKLEFSISYFVSILINISGEHSFILEVTDNNGNMTPKTVKLIVK